MRPAIDMSLNAFEDEEEEEDEKRVVSRKGNGMSKPGFFPISTGLPEPHSNSPHERNREQPSGFGRESPLEDGV